MKGESIFQIISVQTPNTLRLMPTHKKIYADVHVNAIAYCILFNSEQ